jgi:hypothetical protein
MALISSLRIRVLAGALAVCLLFLAFQLIRPHSIPGEVQLQLSAVRRSTNGAVFVTVVLTNGTLRTMNIVDDADGNPAYILDSGGEYGLSLTRMVNQLKLNLAPGSSLTNTVLVTNPPPLFRLKVQLRDLASERTDLTGALSHLLPDRLAQQFQSRRETPLPASDWIETNNTEHWQP